MAMGAYMGAGSVKDLKSCYVGAGGVKTVKQIYIGQGGNVKLVWPSYIYDEGSWGELGGGMSFADQPTGIYPRVQEQDEYIRMYANYDRTYSLTTALRGAYCNSSIDVSLYSKMTVTYYMHNVASRNVSSTENVNSRMVIGCCTGQPYFGTSGSVYNLYLSGTDYSATQYASGSVLSTDVTYTLSVDLSGVSRSVYPYIGCHMGLNLSTTDTFSFRITRIALEI